MGDHLPIRAPGHGPGPKLLFGSLQNLFFRRLPIGRDQLVDINMDAVQVVVQAHFYVEFFHCSFRVGHGFQTRESYGLALEEWLIPMLVDFDSLRPGILYRGILSDG